MKNYVWVVVVLAVLLQTVSNQQEDLTDEELEVAHTKDDREASSDEEPTDPPFQPPSKPSGDVYFAESFTNEDEVWKFWLTSKATKDGVAMYDGEWLLESPTTEGSNKEDQGLVLSEAAKHYAIAAKLDRPFNFEDAEAFVVQYEVNFQNGLSCGGAYIKLLTSAKDLHLFQDKTPYSIMFGPDRCGVNSKIHFIIQFKNPVTGEVDEKHSKQSTESMDFFTDKKTHLFTLLIRSDGVYHIIVDQKPFLKGSIYEDFTPPLVPPKEIDDPEDRMPEGWDEREKIPDPEAVKPDDWDEDAPPKIEDPDAVKPDGWMDDGPEYVPDPDATIPEDWDEEEDGEYEAPMIPNPACEKVGCGDWRPPMIQNPQYKGKWKPQLIENPDYDGKWSPRKIENPAYFEDDSPFTSFSSISAVGFELWTMSEGIMIDNVIVCGELVIANNYARDGWVLKMQKERAVGGGMSLGSWLDSFVELANTYPYLWALYAIAVVLPFVCCIGCCCVKSKPSDEAAKRKKTDAPSPDDPHEEQPPPKLHPSGTKEDDDTFIAAADDQEEEEGGKLSQGEEGGSQGEEGGSQGEEGGSQGEEGGSQDEGAGSQDEGAGSQTENRGSQGEEEERGSPVDEGATGSQEEEEADVGAEAVAPKKVRKRKPRRED